jgi:hypothetical protein
MSLSSHFSDHKSWARTLITAAIIFPLFTVAMYFVTRKETWASEELLGGTSREQRRAVLRAARTGRPPSDRTARAQAAALVEQRLANHARHRVASIATFAVFAAGSAAAAIGAGLWYLGGAALFAGTLIWTIRYPGQLRRKLAALEPPPPSPAPPAKTRL